MDPDPLPTLDAKTYGDIAADDAKVANLYGQLAIRYNGLREWARCMIAAHNGASDKGCM